MRDWLLPATASPADVVATFNDVGFVALKGLLSAAEVAELHAAHDEGIASGSLLASKDDMADNYDTIYRHAVFNRWVRDPRLVSIVRTIFNRGIELQHVKYNAKPVTGGGEAPWHQDFPFFPHTNFDLLAATIYFDDADETNGAIRFVPGSHKFGELSHYDATGRFVYGCSDQEACGRYDSVSLTVPAGTVTFHHCFALHASGRVTSGRQRRLLIFQYRAEDNVQLAGPLWDCTGETILREDPMRRARFPDGSVVTLRGQLVDVFGNLKPQRELISVKQAQRASAPADR
jgi:ectoine hydroxylase-related dioxygenase (phytanoyl-CoA dioxygenase family)